MKPRILQSARLMPALEARLRSEFEAHPLWNEPDPAAFLEARGGEFEILVTNATAGASASMMDALPALKAICSLGVGCDAIDLQAARERGVVVANTPDVLTDCVADIAMGLLIDVARGLSAADRHVRRGKWLEGPFPLTTRVTGKRLGILGLGRIGKAIARRLEACDLEVEYHGRKPQPDVKHRYHPTLLGLAQSCDVLMVVASGGAETHHLVGKDVLEALGPEGIVINVGRGTVIDEQALIAALRDRKILSAGLDVFEDEPRVPAELIAMDHVVLLPHVGSASVHTRNAMGQLVVDNLVSWFGGKGAVTPVPECQALAAAKAKG